MTDDKRPLDHAMDLLFFAPLGLAATARDLVPSLAQRGRQELDPQVGAARMVGQMAVAQGRNQAEKAVERALAQAQATLRQLGLVATLGHGHLAHHAGGTDLGVELLAPALGEGRDEIASGGG
ncbi:MAG TPA: hypothetical protein VNT56_01585, partial [Acidimicrobiales bacterium]|nr:hypothetical protein [Acidimicrobiales bacterium]